MATLQEINTAAADGGTISEKVKGAVLMAAQAIIYEATETTNHANRAIWAANSLTDVQGTATKMQKAVVALAQGNNTSITSSGLLNLSDSLVQDYVNASINIFATGS